LSLLTHPQRFHSKTLRYIAETIVVCDCLQFEEYLAEDGPI
jgi:hypothetical protein